MKTFAISLILVLLATPSFADSVTETGDFKEYFVNFDDASAVILNVASEVYVSARPRSIISIREVDASLYIVEQEDLYYTMEAIDPPLPEFELQDSTNALISEGHFVRILAPAHLTVTVGAYEPRYTCMAYWSGFELNPATGACEVTGTSGCSNPFTHRTIESCEMANGLR